MKLLAITSELPWPLNTGGHLRTFHILKSLAMRFDVRLVVPLDDQSDFGVNELVAQGIEVCPAIMRPRRRLYELLRVVWAAAKGEPYVMYHRHNRSELRRVVASEMKKYSPDVVYLDHVDPFSLRKLFPDSKIVVDLHNVYSKLAGRVADEHSGLRRWYLRREAKLLAKVERRISDRSAAMIAVSQDEVAEFSSLGNRNVCLVPNGVDCSIYSHFPVGRMFSRPTLLYIGAMSWQPNARAASFLAREIVPSVRKKYPDAILKLVGRDPGPEVLALGKLPGVEVHANVPDVGVYLAEASLLVVGLDSGGGTRLKILEAFAAGLPVVSTPVGCEGIDCQHGRELWIAERGSFADATVDALSNPELGVRLAENARLLVHNKYDWSAVGQLACNAVSSVVNGCSET